MPAEHCREHPSSSWGGCGKSYGQKASETLIKVMLSGGNAGTKGISGLNAASRQRRAGRERKKVITRERTHPISPQRVRSLPIQLCLLEPHWHAMGAPSQAGGQCVPLFYFVYF